eukprot:6428058-Prymnesium_polylepis.1
MCGGLDGQWARLVHQHIGQLPQKRGRVHRHAGVSRHRPGISKRCGRGAGHRARVDQRYVPPDPLQLQRAREPDEATADDDGPAR